jgi:hypothetical protein
MPRCWLDIGGPKRTGREARPEGKGPPDSWQETLAPEGHGAGETRREPVPSPEHQIRILVRCRSGGHGLQNALDLRTYSLPHRARVAPHQRACMCNTEAATFKTGGAFCEKGGTSWKHPSEFGRVSACVRGTKNDLAPEQKQEAC